jgi:hypothetical protein
MPLNIDDIRPARFLTFYTPTLVDLGYTIDLFFIYQRAGEVTDLIFMADPACIENLAIPVYAQGVRFVASKRADDVIMARYDKMYQETVRRLRDAQMQ